MNSELTIDVRAEALLSQLAGASARFMDDQRVAVDRLSIDIQSLVKVSKLSGQVLHVRTGTLRRSINRKVSGDSTTIIGQVGTNVEYAAIHEYGFDGDVSVKSYSRKTARGSVDVRAHVMHMRMPVRSYLRSTLDEQAGHIRETLRQTALRSLREG